jgi:hypothetical protein
VIDVTVEHNGQRFTCCDTIIGMASRPSEPSDDKKAITCMFKLKTEVEVEDHV